MLWPCALWDASPVHLCRAIIKDSDNYTGTIVELGAPSKEYDDLDVGDKIVFRIENIGSFSP